MTPPWKRGQQVTRGVSFNRHWEMVECRFTLLTNSDGECACRWTLRPTKGALMYSCWAIGEWWWHIQYKQEFGKDLADWQERISISVPQAVSLLVAIDYITDDDSSQTYHHSFWHLHKCILQSLIYIKVRGRRYVGGLVVCGWPLGVRSWIVRAPVALNRPQSPAQLVLHCRLLQNLSCRRLNFATNPLTCAWIGL